MKDMCDETRKVKLNRQELEEIQEFVYLRSVMDSTNGSSVTDVASRI